MSWSALEGGAPALAREGWAKFQRTRVALLGTVRADGSPRISPVEPFLLGGELVFTVMASPKWDDLRRDPRCALHSSVSDIDGTEGELKIYGRAVPTSEPSIIEAPGTWWEGRPSDRYAVFVVDIDEAVLVTWSLDQSKMTTARWTPEQGATERVRDYP
jgi:Pyridoxamine 5'-phosphate oxidase